MLLRRLAATRALWVVHDILDPGLKDFAYLICKIIWHLYLLQASVLVHAASTPALAQDVTVADEASAVAVDVRHDFWKDERFAQRTSDRDSS